MPLSTSDLSCAALCGRATACGNKHCSNHPAYKKPVNTKLANKQAKKKAERRSYYASYMPKGKRTYSFDKHGKPI